MAKLINTNGGKLQGRGDTDYQAVVAAMNADTVKLTQPERDAAFFLISNLKFYGSWSKITALYRFLGGTFKHKYNWKDLRDLDAAFRLSFVSSISHNSFGVHSIEGV